MKISISDNSVLFALSNAGLTAKASNKLQSHIAETNGVKQPKYIRLYSNENTPNQTIDCFTVVFTGNYRFKFNNGRFYSISSSHNPTHPMGVYSNYESYELIDRPSYSHLGKPITWEKLPKELQRIVWEEYLSLWGFTSWDNNLPFLQHLRKDCKTNSLEYADYLDYKKGCQAPYMSFEEFMAENQY